MTRATVVLIVGSLLIACGGGFFGDHPRSHLPGDEASQAKLSDLYVLAIGVDRYPGGYRLSYAARDAREVARLFEERSATLFRHVDVRFIANNQADRQGILNALDDLRASTRPSDVVVIYYAGHGGNDPPIGFYLAPYRCNDRFWRTTMISADELRGRVESIPAQSIILLDTCYSEALFEKGRWETANRSPNGSAEVVSASPLRTAYLCATRTKEETKGGNRFWHCDFTRALVEGLRGNADDDGDGLVDLGELKQYIDTRLAELRPNKQHQVSLLPAAMHHIVLSRP
jgi:uncharacterized caspase-like protein